MGVQERWRVWRTGHPAGAEVAVATGAGLLVLAAAIWQWGPNGDGAFRGISLGTWIGVAVWLVARRRRMAATRADADRAAVRLALARELHDTVAGEVAAIGIQAAAARRIVEARPADAALALERIEAASRSANADLRRMLDALRSGSVVPPSGAPGLAALGVLADEQTLGRAGAISVAVEPAALALLDPALDRTAYRIAEEAIRNARSHAGPVPIEVRAGVRDGTLEIEVRNAPGRATADWPGSGLGLVGMRERAAVFGGAVEAVPTADGGFRVIARLPVGGSS